MGVPGIFGLFQKRIAGDCPAVSACIDIGHIGIYRAREAYAERHPLDPDVDPLFTHWRDRTNAEKMNHWLDLLARNAALVAESCAGNPVSTGT